MNQVEYHSSALDAQKMQGIEAFNFYKEGMIVNSGSKAQIITRHFPNTLEQGSIVLDLGTCSGALVGEMNAVRPEFKYVGIDLSHKMLKDAVGRSPFATFIEADALHVPIKPDSVSVITMSSILHEIYSYAGARFTYDAVHSVLSNAKSLLRENGRIIIKDPAKPESPDEDLIFTLPAHDGINHDGEGLLFEAPSKLSTKAKYHRFLKEFHPLQKNPHHRFHTPINTENNTYKAPAWLLSEFLRHRSLDFSPEIWYSEMMEMYGVFTVDEAKQAMINNGFTNVQVNTHFNPDNHSAIKNDEIQIWSSDGKPQRQSDRLPTGMLIIADNLSSQRVM